MAKICTPKFSTGPVNAGEERLLKFLEVKLPDGYYLIPNGNGGWQKTDPRKDRDYVMKVNEEKKKMVLPLVRLCKKWFEVKKFETPASYLMETLIIRYCESKNVLDDVIYWRFMEFLNYLENGIYNSVQDMKDIQGNINDLKFSDCYKISESLLKVTGKKNPVWSTKWLGVILITPYQRRRKALGSLPIAQIRCHH